MKLWSPPIRVAPITEEWNENYLRLLCMGFQLDFGMARQVFYDDPMRPFTERWGLWTVVSGEEQLVSVMNVSPAPMWVHGQVIPTAGISGVTTHINHRKQGYSSRLLTDTMPALKQKGFLAAALVPYSHHFYRPLGWETVGCLFRLRLPPKRLPAFTESRWMRRYEVSDESALKKLYAQRCPPRNGRLAREELRWQYVLWNNRRKWVWHDQGEVRGYLLYDLVEEGDVLRVREMVWNHEHARRGMIGWLAQNMERIRTVEFTGSSDDLKQLNLSIFDRQHAPLEQPLYCWEAMPNFMWRVLDVPGLLERLLPPDAPDSMLGGVSFSLQIKDEQCDWNAQRITFFAGEEGELRMEENRRASSIVKMDMRTFSMLTMGAVSPSEASAKHWLKAPESLLPTLDALFPTAESCLTLTDYF
ncbi:MAG: GNAT family N-acetyltransferase [Fimbriimonadia bacterium]|nr:GNAT family N-acetyltransferase [Fimbriimonadia bacterium]